MMEIIHAWHWNPSLWPELALLIVYLGAPMLSALAACIFAYDWIWPARLRPLPEDTDP